MKKILPLLLLSTCALSALEFGNPGAPGIIEKGLFFSPNNTIAIQAGYQRDWVFDRDMKAVSKVRGRLEEFSYVADQGVLTMNIFKRIQCYGSVGALRISSRHTPNRTTLNEYETHDELTWGVGSRILFLQWQKLSFGIDGKYQSAKPSMRWMTSNGTPTPPASNTEIRMHEWQIGLGVSGQISLLYPYIGVKYSNAKSEFKNLPKDFLPNTTRFNTSNRRKFGLVLGSSISNGSLFSLNVEARLIDEEALSLSAELQF